MIVLEGIRNVVLPCTLALLVPAVAAVLAGRGRPVVAAGYVLGAAAGVIGAGAVGLDVPPVTLARVAVAVVLAAGLLLLRSGPTLAGGAGAVVVGVVAASLWEPCVGPELGATLTAAPAAPVRAALPLAGYAIGATLPVPVVAALGQLRDERLPRWLGVVGTVAGAVLVGALALGLYDDGVSALVRATLT